MRPINCNNDLSTRKMLQWYADMIEGLIEANSNYEGEVTFAVSGNDVVVRIVDLQQPDLAYITRVPLSEFEAEAYMDEDPRLASELEFGFIDYMDAAVALNSSRRLIKATTYFNTYRRR